MTTLQFLGAFFTRHLKSLSFITLAATAAVLMLQPPPASGISSTIVISQVYGGGGNSTAPFQNDYIELFNRGASPVSLDGWSVQYSSSTGTSWQKTDLTNVTLQPGQYYLVREAAGTGCSGNPCGASVPFPDASGTIAMSGTAGKVALLNTNTLIASGTSCPSGANVIDIVGYGAGANCSETAPTAAPSNTNAVLRGSNGCTETDNNGADFSAGAPNPRTTASPVSACAPPLPSLSIDDVSVIEGNSGTATATFTVTLSAPAPAGGASFDIATQDNTATVANSDYVAKTLTAQTIAAGATTYSFSVTVNGDANVEPNESFFVNLSNPVGATITRGQGVGTIVSDDIPPTLSINDVAVTEGNSGTTTATFTVSLASPALPGGVTFDIATQDNTATAAGNDYVAKSMTGQTIAAGGTSYTFSVTINGDVDTEPNESFFVNVTNVMGATVGDGQGVGTINTDDVPPTLIHDIQGTAETPNFNNQVVLIRGVVVGDFQGSTNLNGFFVEEEQSDWDADPNTSEGIFVFAPAAPNVNAGDNVTVTGTVVNFPVATGLTELTTVTSVVVNSTGNALPPAQAVTLPVPTSAAADLEKYEGMRVTFGTLYVTDNDSLGQFGELGLSSSRLFIPTNSIDPNDAPANGNTTSGASNAAAVTAQQSLNNRGRILLNDGRTGSNPAPIPFIGAGTNATVRLGDSVSNLAGVLSYGFGSYRVEPTGTVTFTAGNPRPAAPNPVGGSLKIATANIENWFFTLNTGRGATNAAERDRQRDKLVALLAGLNADVIGLIELEKGTAANPDAAVNELIAKLNTLGVGTYAAVATPAAVYDAANPVGTDTDIKSGMIYRTGTVSLAGASLTDTAAAAGTYSRAPIAQAFQSKTNGAKFSVVVNHLRSKSCGSPAPSGEDGDQSTGQSCYNARRRSQSQALVNFINTVLAPIDPDVMAIGDFNAYTQEDPIDLLRAAGLTDLLAAGEYSFAFDGQVGRLDHMFATPSFVPQVTGATVWHINSDEPDVFDYNTEFKTDDRYAPTPFRSADHDPALAGVNLACPAVTVDPASLPGGTAGAAYAQTVTAAGSVGAFLFTITAGALPDGLSLTTSGSIAGTPSKVGTFNFTVTATAGACTGSREYSITIGCPALTLSPVALLSAFRGSDYAETFMATGGAAPIVYSLTGQRPAGIQFNATTGRLSGTFTQAGNYNFTITATDANGCNTSRDYTLTVYTTSMKITDPAVCLGPGGVVSVEATVTNSAATPKNGVFNAVLPASLLALPGTCTANVGACSVDAAASVAWQGTVAANQTVTIRFNAQAADGAAQGTQACISSNASFEGSAPGGVSACTTITCPAGGPGNPLPATSPVSDQRTGSVLIYNVYTSAVDPNRQNTRLNITNTEPSRPAYVHLFFVDGATCQVADSYICLTANQTATFLASDLDPGVTGYVVAVAVDRNGCPVNFNYLIGDEYVKFATGHAANLAAESVTAIGGGLPVCNQNSTTASLAFDGVSYSALPHVLAVDNIPSRADGNETILVLNRIGGNLATGAASLGSLFGILYDDAETPVSFSLASSACQLRGSVSGTFPRTAPRFEQLVPSGHSGWMKLWVSGGTVAMTGAMINFNPNAAAAAGAYNQGHNLHALTTTASMVYTMPVFPPSC